MKSEQLLSCIKELQKLERNNIIDKLVVIDAESLNNKKKSDSSLTSLFDKLNKDSALAGYLLPNESRAGKISRTVFNASTKSLFEGGPVSDLGEEAIYRTVKNYLEAVDVIFKQTENKNARISKTVLFKAIMVIFNEVCEKCLIKYKNVKVESLIDYLYPICQLNFEEYTGTNNATVNKIVNDLRNLLKEKVELSEEMF